MSLRDLHRRDRNSRGQALVETALVLPVVVLIVLLGIDLGRVFFVSIDLRNAAHEATMVGGLDPEAECADLLAAVDRQMGRSGASCAAPTGQADIVFITRADCERGDPGTGCSTWQPIYPPDADLRYVVRIEFRFQPVVPIIGLLTGNGMGGSMPIAVENRSPILVAYDGSQ